MSVFEGLCLFVAFLFLLRLEFMVFGEIFRLLTLFSDLLEMIIQMHLNLVILDIFNLL